jgi:hypothetical protein
MSSFTSPLRRAGRRLAAHVRRLRAALMRLAAEVRAAVARAVGQATGDAVRDALRVILDGPPAQPAARDPPEDIEGLWGQPRRPRWPPGPYHERYDPYEVPQRETDYLEDDQDVEPDEDPAPEGPSEPPSAGAWSRAVAVGCQAAAWWLRRHPGPLALLAAVGIGLAASVAALVGGPLVAGGSAAAAAALAALALADAAVSAADLAADAVP